MSLVPNPRLSPNCLGSILHLEVSSAPYSLVSVLRARAKRFSRPMWNLFQHSRALNVRMSLSTTVVLIEYYSHVRRRGGEAFKARRCSGQRVNHKCIGRWRHLLSCVPNILSKGLIALAFAFIYCQHANHACVGQTREGAKQRSAEILFLGCVIFPWAQGVSYAT